MKRFIALFLACLLLMSLTLVGCGKAKEEGAKDSAKTDTKTETTDKADDSGKKEEAAAPVADEVADDPSVKVLNVWSFTDEVPKMLEKYKELHPDFPYEIKTTIIATTDGAYQPALDQALAGGGADAPDLYTAESAFVLKYAQGMHISTQQLTRILVLMLTSSLKSLTLLSTQLISELILMAIL